MQGLFFAKAVHSVYLINSIKIVGREAIVICFDSHQYAKTSTKIQSNRYGTIQAIADVHDTGMERSKKQVYSEYRHLILPKK